MEAAEFILLGQEAMGYAADLAMFTPSPTTRKTSTDRITEEKTAGLTANTSYHVQNEHRTRTYPHNSLINKNGALGET